MNPTFSACTPLSRGRLRPARPHTFRVLVVLLLSVLSLRGAPPSEPRPPAAIPSTATPAPASAGLPPSPAYRLSPNDTVHIRVYQEEDLETSARIGKNGIIPFPLLGSVNIGGRTVQEATAGIEAALRAYIIRPQVALRIVEYTKRKFTVLGQVNRPGTYDFPDDSALSLLEGIGMAGGYTRIANPSRITVKRIDPQGEQVFRLDGKKMAREKNALRFELRPGDTLEIDESLF